MYEVMSCDLVRRSSTLGIWGRESPLIAQRLQCVHQESVYNVNLTISTDSERHCDSLLSSGYAI